MSDEPRTDGSDWRPSAGRGLLERRAELNARLRAFFARRGVLEVETPILSSAAATDPHIESFTTRYAGPGAPSGQPRYLHTSPEFPMKRLLAAGSGPIYQLCKVFRQGEVGRRHQPEFTMLEWYRPGLDHHGLMDEVEALLVEVVAGWLSPAPALRLSYAEAFERYLGIDPHRAGGEELQARARDFELGTVAGLADDDRDGWLELLQAGALEPRLPRGQPVFVYDFPASQAALARLRPGPPPVAERFELYLDGMELANGFHELADAHEQRRRFEADARRRRRLGAGAVAADERLLAALGHGLPDCAGVALGVDRLLMLLVGASSIGEVVAFDWARA